MTLRSRLSVTSLAIAVPLALGLFLIDERLRLGAMEESLTGVVDGQLANQLRERCEATGGLFRGGRGVLRPLTPPLGRQGREGRGAGPNGPPPGGRGRGGVEIFTYDAAGRPASPESPTLPDTSPSTFRPSWREGRGIQVVFPIGGGGACAQGLARMPPRPGQTRDQLVAVTLSVFAALAAAWFAAGPVISRLRALTDGVRRASAANYDQPLPVAGTDEVAALTHAFNDAGERVRAHIGEVQAREQALRQFVADTTHDLAMPLTVLQGHLAELDEHASDAPNGGSTSAVRAAIKEAHYIASLLRNLAAASKLGETSAPLTWNRVDLSATVERVVLRHRPLARALGVELNLAVPDPPLMVDADATLLEQALSNLVDNAVRYNHAGGHVAVVGDSLREEAGPRFLLSVTDDGPGVEDAELGRLTTRWFRGSEARTRRPDGTGLGLSIASESVDRLGWALTFAHGEAGGLRAEITGPTQRLEQG